MKQKQNKQISKSFLLLFQADYSYTKMKRLWSSDPPDNLIRHTVIVSGSEPKQTYNKYSKAPLKGLLEVINFSTIFFWTQDAPLNDEGTFSRPVPFLGRVGKGTFIIQGCVLL